MKRNILAFAVLLTAGTLFLASCNKEDTTPPVITLLGDDPYELKLNSSYVEPGATAEDDEDGDVSGNIVIDDSDINKDVVGSYTVHYEVTDAAGNIGDQHRVVNVYNELTSSPWTGNYACIITTGPGSPYSYSESLAISTTLNNATAWSKFGDYSNATAKLNMVISGGSVTIPTQSITCGSPAVLRQFAGSGAVVGTGGAGSTITLQIQETVNGVTDNFTYVYTKQ